MKTFILARNSLGLAVRMLFVLLVSLIITRLLLNKFGAQTYGVISVVVGLVSMFGILNQTLAASVQRFISYDLGGNNGRETSGILSTSMSILFVFGLLVLLIGLPLSEYIVVEILNIPENLIDGAIDLLRLCIISLFFTLLNVPLNAILIAYEKVLWFAIVSTSEAILKLLGVLFISYINAKYFSYGLALLGSSLTSLGINLFILKKFKLGNISIKSINLKHFIEIFKFSSWTSINIFSSVTINHGFAILINMFFGALLSAARGVADQVSNGLNALTGTVNLAFRPVLIKLYASKQNVKLLEMFLYNNLLLLLVFSLIGGAVLLFLDEILTLWLNDYPTKAYDFIVYNIFFGLLMGLQYPITTVVYATGNIARYSVLVESIVLLSFPATWLFFYLKFDSDWLYYCLLVFFGIAHFARIYILKNILEEVNFYSLYLKNVVIWLVLIVLYLAGSLFMKNSLLFYKWIYFVAFNIFLIFVLYSKYGERFSKHG